MSAATQADANIWQPIETAPRDGTSVLVVNDNVGGRYTKPFQIGVASWGPCMREEAWGSDSCCDNVTCFTPTHWQPLPNAPSLPSDANANTKEPT